MGLVYTIMILVPAILLSAFLVYIHKKQTKMVFEPSSINLFDTLRKMNSKIVEINKKLIKR